MKKETLYALALITFIGTVLRVYHLGFQRICGDESFTLMVVQKSFPEIITWSLTNDCSPPLFYLLSHLAYISSGFAVYATRIPSTFFGILAIPAMYYLAAMYRRNTLQNDGETLGILAATITAILYPLIYYSQFARSFEMVFFLSILFFWQFLKIRRNDKIGSSPITDYYLLGLLGALMFWTNLFAIIPVFTVILSMFFTTPRRNALYPLAVAILAFLPLIPLFVSTRAARAAVDYLGTPAMDLPAFIAIEFFYLGLFIMIPLIILGLYFEKWDSLSIELFAILTISTVIGILVSFATQVVPRYFFPALPMLIVFACIGVAGLMLRVKPFARPVVAVGFLVMLGLSQYGALVVQYWVAKGSC